MKAELLLKETVFLNRSIYKEAERLYPLRNTPVSEASIEVGELVDRLHHVEAENKQLKGIIEKLEARLAKLETGGAATKPAAAQAPAAKAAPAPAKKDDDDDIDLFGESDEETEEKKKVREDRLKAYADKKSKKAEVIAKSSVLLDVKVWDDETDLAALEKSVRSIQMDGLVWGSSKLVPVAFGVKKLQIQCVIEDDKVSTEVLEEKICEFEDFVQSVDIASFNKI